MLAMRNAPLAAELDQHPDNVSPSHPHLHKKNTELAERARLARGYAADEIRNRSAADALELYYKLAGAEGQSDFLLAAHGFLRPQLVAAEKAAKLGAASEAEVDRIRRQLLDLESQAAKLGVAIAGLNAGLSGALGLDPGDPAPIWPIEPLRVASEQPDADHAVHMAFTQRPDLNLLRSLAGGNGVTGELTNSVLAAVNPLLAAADSNNPIMALLAALKKKPTETDAKAQQQLLGLLATRQQQAEAEVRAAVAAIRGNRNVVAALTGEVRILEGRVAEEEKRLAAGVAGAEATLTTARLELLKARGELLQAVVDWHLSDVRLRQATGTLVREPISNLVP